MTEETQSIIEYDDDISQAEQPDPLPIGDYPFSIRAAEIAVSTNTGNKYAKVSCYISPDDFPADYDSSLAPDGVTLIYRRVSLENTPQARFRLRQWCEAIGAPMSSRIDLNEWIGLGGLATIDHDEWEGVMRENITRVSAE